MKFSMPVISIMLISLAIAFSLFVKKSPMIGVCYAGGPTWAWEDGGYERDGSVTLGGENYDVNPIGARDLTGRSMRQPPTVIVQSTNSVGWPAILYSDRVKGDFGGDAYCVSTFGTGYVMANHGEIIAFTQVQDGGVVNFWANTPGLQNCSGWTTDSGLGATGTFGVSNEVIKLNVQPSSNCNSAFSVPCIKR